MSLYRLSPAKINLTLRVCGARPDGFHEIESLVARLAWGDDVRVSTRDDGRITLACRTASDATAAMAAVPADERNLAWRAARALQAATGSSRGAHIELVKRIPTGAGLGGGSSNAATVLAALNELWHTGLNAAELGDIGAAIGSDVALFLHAPLCVISGRGERVQDWPRALRGEVVLVLPPIHCATPAVYAAWDGLAAAAASPARLPLAEFHSRDSRPAVLMPMLYNDLEEPAFRAIPELRKAFDAVSALAAAAVRMTGSGAAFFRLFESLSDAHSFAGQVRRELGFPAVIAPLASA